MRLIIVVAAIAASLAYSTGQTTERIPPWCLKASLGRGWSPELCYFWTSQRCNQERFLYDPTSFCIVKVANRGAPVVSLLRRAKCSNG